MKYFLLFTTCHLLLCNAQKSNNEWPSFPDDFMFGVATAAFQTEGAVDVDGKGESMWDYLIRTNPEAINDKSNANIACNSYYLYKRDIEMLKELGVKSYRFSISWPRILPNGHSNYVNPAGIAHYNTIIDELLANDIVPFVTMYHWDLPQGFNDLGGWLNEDIVDWFGDYARVLYENFGDRVKYWLTINEPFIHCQLGYAFGVHAPKIKSPGTGFYDCGRNILLANAKAYHIYDEYRARQGGQVALVYSMDWLEPASDSPDDYDAALSAMALSEYAPGFYKLLMYIKENYNNPPIYITENGYSTGTLGLDDDDRIAYIRNYLSALLAARLDGANIKAYHVWSLMDDFQWNFGYRFKMGLYEVDMTHLNRTRVPRKSALVYKEIIRSREINYIYNPDPSTGGSYPFKPLVMLIAASFIVNYGY